jgi:hypothetical protein
VRLDVLMTVYMKATVSWDLTSSSLVSLKRFGGTYCLASSISSPRLS